MAIITVLLTLYETDSGIVKTLFANLKLKVLLPTAIVLIFFASFLTMLLTVDIIKAGVENAINEFLPKQCCISFQL